MTRKGRDKELSLEDRALWDEVKKTTKPINPRQPFKFDAEKSFTEGMRLDHCSIALPQPQLRDVEAFTIGGTAVPRQGRHNLASSISEEVAQLSLRMDKKKFTKMRSGKLMPERKLDLHGMTVAQAHPELIHFVLDAVRDHLRLVLVVTGKGKMRDDGGPIPVKTGILKHNVPQWLRMAPLSGHILQIAQAHLRHGGAGAYYVYLKRNK